MRFRVCLWLRLRKKAQRSIGLEGPTPICYVHVYIYVKLGFDAHLSTYVSTSSRVPSLLTMSCKQLHPSSLSSPSHSGSVSRLPAQPRVDHMKPLVHPVFAWSSAPPTAMLGPPDLPPTASHAPFCPRSCEEAALGGGTVQGEEGTRGGGPPLVAREEPVLHGCIGIEVTAAACIDTHVSPVPPSHVPTLERKIKEGWGNNATSSWYIYV